VTAGDYPDWSAPQAHATAIADTGVPLLAVPLLLANVTQTVNAGADLTSAAYAMPQIAYEIALFAVANGAGAAGPLLVNMIWRDSTNTYLLGNEEWWIWPGTAGNIHQIIGTGPCKGANLFIELKNTGAAMSYSVQYVLYSRSNVYTRDDWRSVAYAASQSGNAVAVADPSSLHMAFASSSVAAAGNKIWEIPLITGICFMHCSTSSAATDMSVTIQNSANANDPSINLPLVHYKSDANGYVTGLITLPRFNCRVTLANGNAGAQTLGFSLVYQDAAA
jgi:hypothetical protein